MTFRSGLINALLTATYWTIGFRIVEFEYQGRERKEYYGENLLDKLSKDLMVKYGRGFSRPNLTYMKLFYQIYSDLKICQTLSDKSPIEGKLLTVPLELNKKIVRTMSEQSFLPEIAQHFKLPWSAYVRLLFVKDDNAREFYETEALRNGWSVRQLDRQISTQFYERTLLSKNKAAMLRKGAERKDEDFVTPEEAIKDPFVLEFL